MRSLKDLDQEGKQEKYRQVYIIWHNPIFPIYAYAYMPPRASYLRISLQIHVRARWKNLTFPNYKFGKGQYAFYPVQISFAKKKNGRNTGISYGGAFRNWSEASPTDEKFKSPSFSEGFLVIQTSWIFLNS